MSAVHVVSVLLLGSAWGWAGAIMVRLRDWRLAIPCVFLALLLIDQLLSVSKEPAALSSLFGGVGDSTEVPGLLVAAFSLLAVGAVGRVLTKEPHSRPHPRQAGEQGRDPDGLGPGSAGQRETRIDLLARQIPAIVWSCDTDLIVDSVFGAGLSAVGIEPQSLIGESVGTNLDDPKEGAVVLAAHHRALGRRIERVGTAVRVLPGRPPPDWETSLRPFDVQWRGRWFRVFIRPLRDGGGGVIGTVGVALDLDDPRRDDQTAPELSGRLEHLREQERRALARDVHDELGQVLTALRMELLSGLESTPGYEAEKVIRGSAYVELVDAALVQVRSIAQRLRPPELDDLGLLEAIRGEVESFGRRARVRWKLRSDVGEIPPNFDRDIAIFRILQESLTNVARHAGATRVVVQLTRGGGRLRLAVYDNGRGIAEDGGDTLGLMGMRERARSLGGSLAVRARPEGGTAVLAEIPIEPQVLN